MTKCGNCGISVMERPLMRVNETGINGIFWCHPCTQSKEPELYKNLLEDQSPVEQTLIDIFYGSKSK